MSINAVAEAGQATTDAQVIAELAAGALESIARIHAAGLAEVVDIAENPVVLSPEPVAEVPAPVEASTDTEVTDEAEAEAEAPVEDETEAPVETPIEAETLAETDVEVQAEVPATDAEPATAEFATPAEALRAVPVSTRGRHFSEAETTEFAAQRAA
ncbi:hypothetical protein O2W14_00110 [Modestobacter sp. VKM Ac-2986]|uniref:hypothetical protein n=1 Tax=Modestobacter sp. VKM Ac-2986 TaxID=3004140 RepID=UPI0022AB049E|nr:hypothetical protein [Modestobacter sp. VKM Ac-2986]MCZ2827234.1 hypothetical protein [Modestobacter sp. VKM Ac-2986]